MYGNVLVTTGKLAAIPYELAMPLMYTMNVVPYNTKHAWVHC